MKKIIVGNWKMNGTRDMARELALAVAGCGGDARVVLCPPAVLLAPVVEALSGSRVAAGGQDCHAKEKGAYTGDISAAMLKDAGCEYVIVGHSERRQAYGETDVLVRAKATAAIASGLIPIICFGESDAERSAGRAEEIVARQVADSIPDEAGEGNFVLAYEPVWAIGSGKTATLDDIARMHAHVLGVASAHTGLSGPQIAVLYGGSVNAANAAEILATPGVSGVLVGGASLKEDEFCTMIKSA